MPTTAWIPANAVGGSQGFSNTDRIAVSDNLYATMTYQHAYVSAGTFIYLVARWVDVLGIPAGSSLTSARVRIEGKATAALVIRSQLQLAGVGYSGVAEASSFSTSDSVKTLAAMSPSGSAAFDFDDFRVLLTPKSLSTLYDGQVMSLDLVEIEVTYTLPAAPTVASITPAEGPLAGGTQVEILGTGFQTDSTVTIDGVACTNVTYVNSGKIRCTTPAGSGGPQDVVVTNGGGSGTLTNGYTYLQVRDANVRLLKGGAYVGDDKALTTTDWDANAAYTEYGGAADMWGTTLTPAEVNAADFGVGVAAVVGANAEARILHIEMEVHYTVPGVSDPQTYLSILKTDADRTTSRPAIYRLPRSGWTIANDPSLDRKVSNASFFTSRIYEPARYIEKTYRVVEFEATLDPDDGNTPGLEVWARVDDGTAFQLRDNLGQPFVLRVSGPAAAYFTPTDASRGKYLQLEFRVPALEGDEVPVAVDVRNVVLRFSYRPERTEEHTLPIILGSLPDRGEGLQLERRSAYQKLLKLMALCGPGRPPVAMRDALGRDVYVHLTDLTFEEITYRERQDPDLVAFVQYRLVDFDGRE